MSFQEIIKQGIPSELPTKTQIDQNHAHAPMRVIVDVLSPAEFRLAIENALRYFPKKWHRELATEFSNELKSFGRIYMHRFRPKYKMFARPIDAYPAQNQQASAIMLMIQNNLDPMVAKYPHELITYGGNGSVFQNWAQYLLTMQYLSKMTEEQTLVMYSGHPMGLFPSSLGAPRVVITNGMMIPNYSKKADWNKYSALGVTQYGQMTAGSFMYIGPQGIVHGTTITLLNAGRLHGLGDNLRGSVYVTSGLGGMSGAQAIAGMITEAITVIAEVDKNAIDQRVQDGYIQSSNIYADLSELINEIKISKEEKRVTTLVYYGNIVELWEAFAEDEIVIELGSDQTSLHNIDDMGYCPVGYSFEEAEELMRSDKAYFMNEIKISLHRHVAAINMMTARGTYFWDYGNAFLLEAGNADTDIWKDSSKVEYRYPSYVEDIMGPMCFDLGFGPFRWVCTSGELDDLNKTDEIAGNVLRNLKKSAIGDTANQLEDNIKWIDHAKDNIPLVGSKSRILYADAWGRIEIAKAFNCAIRDGVVRGPVVLGRDHHDVSGTDSPYRETANINDGSRFTADMAIQNVIGDSFRGATWVSIHNGGGVGWGEVINGGFGMVLDGSVRSFEQLESMLFWDVNNGLARRSWARNEGAMDTIKRAMKENPNLEVTLPNLVDKDILPRL